MNLDSLTPQQIQVRDAALRLAATLDDLVPDTTVHYAVEDARTSLRFLLAKVDGIITHDVKAKRQAEAEALARATGSVGATVIHEHRDPVTGELITDSIATWER